MATITAFCRQDGMWTPSNMSVLRAFSENIPQVCNKCGLFERTHFIPRPKKFPRRKTLSSRSPKQSSVCSMKNTIIGSAPRHGSSLTPRLLPSHPIDVLDPTSKESAPLYLPRASAIASDASLSLPQVPPCHLIPERQDLRHADRQSLSSISEAAMWLNHVDLPDRVS